QDLLGLGDVVGEFDIGLPPVYQGFEVLVFLVEFYVPLLIANDIGLDDEIGNFIKTLLYDIEFVKHRSIFLRIANLRYFHGIPGEEYGLSSPQRWSPRSR